MPPTERTKSILITGCSSDIGLDVAIELHNLGWRVFAACRQAADCERVKNEFELESCSIDHTKPETVASGHKHVSPKTGKPTDALCNNGAHGIGGTAEDTPRWRRAATL